MLYIKNINLLKLFNIDNIPARVPSFLLKAKSCFHLMASSSVPANRYHLPFRNYHPRYLNMKFALPNIHPVLKYGDIYACI